VATPEILLDQEPPVVVDVQVVAEPVHNGVVPVIVCKMGEVTVTVFVAVLIQPPAVVTEYVITAFPAEIPVIFPVEILAEAIPGVLLDHEPPVVVDVHIDEDPMHNGVVPLMDCVTGEVIVTVFVAVLTHPPSETE